MLSSMRHSRWFHRHAWLVVAPLIAVGIIGALLTRQTEPDLTILCSNKAEACEAVAHSFEAAQGVNALVVRVPTSQALAHISSPNARGEFDVWMGGPAEAYTQAAADGLLRPLASEPANSIPGRWKDPGRRWFGIYGGVLSLCVANDAVAPVSWDALIDPAYADAIAMPHPSTSGTAATILWSQVERLGSEDGARAYYRALEKNVGTYTTSGTFPAPIVAGGRLPLALTFDSYCLAERNAGKAVHPVYFADGVGYEIGSVGVLAGTTRPELAEAFVGYAIADEGQMVSAAASTQYPTSAALAGNLSTTLDAVAVPIFGEDIERAGAHRSELIATWERDRLGDSPYLEALPRSLVVALAAGLVSALAGMALALGYRFGRFRVLTAMLAVTPFLLPPATWALALTYPPFGLDVDGTGVVILASAISSVPIGFAVSLLALAAVGDRHLIEARALGLPRSAIAARLGGAASGPGRSHGHGRGRPAHPHRPHAHPCLWWHAAVFRLRDPHRHVDQPARCHARGPRYFVCDRGARFAPAQPGADGADPQCRPRLTQPAGPAALGWPAVRARSSPGGARLDRGGQREALCLPVRHDDRGHPPRRRDRRPHPRRPYRHGRARAPRTPARLSLARARP